jgi:hypothetical protein
MEISVRDHRELTAVVLAFTRLENTVRNEINRATRATLNPIWQGEVRSKVRTKMDEKVIAKGARVKPGNPPVLMAAQSTKAIGGRLRPADDWQGWEFGADRSKTSTYDRRNPTAAGTHGVTRHASRQMPPVTRTGRVAYPALAGTALRAAALWVQTVVRVVHEAAEGKS